MIRFVYFFSYTGEVSIEDGEKWLHALALC